MTPMAFEKHEPIELAEQLNVISELIDEADTCDDLFYIFH